MTSDFQLFNETDMLQPPEFQRDRASVDRRVMTARRRPAELLEDGRKPRGCRREGTQVSKWVLAPSDNLVIRVLHAESLSLLGPANAAAFEERGSQLLRAGKEGKQGPTDT